MERKSFIIQSNNFLQIICHVTFHLLQIDKLNVNVYLSLRYTTYQYDILL